MTIPQQAIEAAKSALCDIGLHSQEGGLDGPFGVRFVEGPVEQVITTILTAARPHIEAELRAEIAAEILSSPRVSNVRINDHYDHGAHDATLEAAQIAEGKQ